jgi:spermidine synthase
MPLNDNDWITEVFSDRTAFSVRSTGKLFEEVSPFQKIEIFQTDVMGRVLLLNGCFMVTEKDAFIYHEMLVHPAMAVLSAPRKALVIGGGDGGAITELVKYPLLETIILCEIDPRVVESCREYMPAISAGLDDPRVKLVFEDGALFVREHRNEFDLVLVDSTDPVGPGVVLFEMPFYESVAASVTENGIAVFQTESPLFMEDVFVTALSLLRKVFGPDCAHPYFATIPCYPGGLWSFTFCSRRHNPIREAPTGDDPAIRGLTRYYDRRVHEAAFVPPVFVGRLIQEKGRLRTQPDGPR